MSKKIRAKYNRKSFMKLSLRSFWTRTKPVKESRDNKDVLVGSSGDNCNKIRYPKKVRKTAWKRFYKLFPHLKK
jgi:hypothetical protein